MMRNRKKRTKEGFLKFCQVVLEHERYDEMIREEKMVKIYISFFFFSLLLLYDSFFFTQFFNFQILNFLPKNSHWRPMKIRHQATKLLIPPLKIQRLTSRTWMRTDGMQMVELMVSSKVQKKQQNTVRLRKKRSKK